MCLCIFTHQLFIGLSVYTSVRLSSAVLESGLGSHQVISDALWYMLLMILPYFPGYLSGYCKTRWESTGLAGFWTEKSAVYQQAPAESKLGFYTAQVRDVYSRFTEFVHYGLSSLLNFAFSLAMIGLFIEYRFLLAIGVTFILVLIISRKTGGRMQVLAESESRETSVLTHHLKDIHPNALSGNRINRQSWQQRMMTQVSCFTQARNAHAGFRSVVFLLSALFSLLPTTALMIYLIIFADISDAVLLAIMMNLTRIYHLIGSINDVIEIFLSLPSIRGLINTMEEFDVQPQTMFRMKTGKIRINDQPADSFDLTQVRPGRFQVHGKNGSGKTTFLRRLESRHEILYFNPALRVDWPWVTDPSLSDGQYSRQCLIWLLTKTEGPLALDEWDAFLDAGNRDELNKLIETQSHGRVILEVRQRQTVTTDALYLPE